MSDVTLSSAVRSNLLSLQTTADLMSKTQERLATGLKVNSALDNPTNFFTASSLNSRSSDLARLMDGVSNAKQTLDAADNGITALTKLVESAQAVARQAEQSPETVFVAGVFGSTIVNDTNATVTGTQAFAEDNQVVVGQTVTGLDIDDTAASAASTETFTGTNDLSTIASVGDTITIEVGSGLARTYEVVQSDGDPTSGGNTAIGLDDGVTANSIADIFAAIQSHYPGDSGAVGSTIGLGGSGNLEVNAANVGQGDISVITSGTLAGNLSDFSATTTNSTLAGLTGSISLLDSTNNLQTVDMSTINSAQQFSDAIATLGDVSGTVGPNGVSFAADAPWTMNGTGDAGALGFVQHPQSSQAGNVDIEALDGQTLIIGDDTLTFGSDDGAGEINTRAEFETALANLTTPGIEASIDGTTNQLTISATDSPDTTFEVGGTADSPWQFFGIDKTTYTGTSSALTSFTGPNSFWFNQGEGIGNTEINTIGIDSTRWVAAIASAVPGATYDEVDQRVEITPLDGVDTITITGDGARKLGLEPGAYSVGDTTNPERAEFVDQYNEIMQQIDELVEDSGFNGVNLLDGDDLSVIFNEDGSSSLDIAGVTFDAAGLGLTELSDTDFDDAASLSSVLKGLDTAIGSLRSQASAFGSNLSIVETREDFTKATINTLETGAANLTLADTNMEGANLLSLQTRQSLSSTALSLASQADQNVLRLF